MTRIEVLKNLRSIEIGDKIIFVDEYARGLLNANPNTAYAVCDVIKCSVVEEERCVDCPGHYVTVLTEKSEKRDICPVTGTGTLHFKEIISPNSEPKDVNIRRVI